MQMNTDVIIIVKLVQLQDEYCEPFKQKDSSRS